MKRLCFYNTKSPNILLTALFQINHTIIIPVQIALVTLKILTTVSICFMDPAWLFLINEQKIDDYKQQISANHQIWVHMWWKIMLVVYHIMGRAVVGELIDRFE